MTATLETLSDRRSKVAKPGFGHSKNAHAQSRLRPRTIGLGFGVLAICAVAAWTTTRTGGKSGSDDIQAALVEPRSFNVVLKEKGELKAAKSTDVKCEVEGRSTIISLIPEGTPVQEGDLLVTLASDEIDNKIRESELKEANAITAFDSAKAELDIQLDKNASDIRKADLQIRLKDLELKKYEEGDWAQKQRDAEIAIEQAQITLERRNQDFQASKQLYDKKYTTQTEYEEAEFNFKKAEWDLAKARMALEVLTTYTYAAESMQKNSDLQEATKEYERVVKNAEAEENKKRSNLDGRDKELVLIRDQLAKFRTQKEKCRIVAPTPGFVVYYTGGGGGRWMMNSDQQIKEGAEVFERQVLMQLPDTSSMMVSLRIHEAKTDKLQIDQPVEVTIEGQPGRTFAGKVSKIAPLADSQSSWLNPDLKEYETEILLEPTDVSLKPGVTAHAEILVTAVEDQLAIPVPAIYAKSGRRYVFRQNRSGAEPVPVQVGAVGNEWAEISSGLQAGDRVLLAFTDEHRRMIQDGAGGEERAGGTPGSTQRRGPGGGPGRGGGRPGGKPGAPKQTSAEPAAKPAEAQKAPEVAAKSAETDKSTDSPTLPAATTSPTTPAGSGGRSSGQSP